MEGRGYGVTPLMLCSVFKLDCFNDETQVNLLSEASLSPMLRVIAGIEPIS